MTKKIASIKGMNDVLPAVSANWEWLEERLRHLMSLYGYSNIRTPILEQTALFTRGLGQVTDIVEKEMYSFEDQLNGEKLTLRPESTAGVVRSVVEHSLLYEGGKRLYYMGPMFRHERPQRGRYRQFHQFGAEALGFAGPDVDAELIVMVQQFWQMLGLKNIRLEINSLGQPQEREAHRTDLIRYLEQHQDLLDADAQRRLYTNPLRILDTKNPQMQEMVNAAPKLIDYLGAESLAHFDGLRAILDGLGIAYQINPRLVRGLDYYNLSVFEFVTDELGSQGTVCAGGRYDHLIEQVGGKPAPAVGWAMGVERILELLEATTQQLPKTNKPDIYAIVPDTAAWTTVARVLRDLRTQGLRIQMHAKGQEATMTSMKSQFKKADASGARWAMVFGAEELSRGVVAVKTLRPDAGGQVPAQQECPLDGLSSWFVSQTE
ncbi:MAG: Histidine--tRNA ligase [Pseudomonadota bacterium]|jgi:histidyl-tRNA synthetase